ncbi:hypothetical protein B296_00056832 [Ensete ventricosum]|uniref:Uncharacterized protein n=1 Tax=Ensete ventricosum TaxID=4639 RepID=A0A426XTM9_ENSVE|nr:hypothetical protein B296_00056832 [Ensete ventricosum]
MYEVFNLVLHVIALLGVMSVVAVEVTVAPAVTFLGLSLHWVRGFKESFLPNLEEDLSLGRVEQNVGELGNVDGKAWHIMVSDMPYRAICARNVATCFIGSEPPSCASSVGRRKCCGMGVSWISWIKGEPQRGLSPCLSFILCTSSIPWFTKRSYALRESVESEKSVLGSGVLRVDALCVDVRRLTASLEGAWSDSGKSWGRLSTSCLARGRPSVSGVTPVGARGATWGCEISC